MKLFEETQYKQVLRRQIEAHRGVRAYRAALAQAIGCQQAFISRVLNAELHLTPDHALKLALFWGFSEKERDYFMLLVEHARAGSKELRDLIATKLRKIRDAEDSLSGRYGGGAEEGTLDRDLAAVYYSNWIYAALHFAVTIPKLQTVEALVEEFQLPRKRITGALKELEKLGVVSHLDNRWVANQKNVHLSKNSPMLAQYLQTWRQQALVRYLGSEPKDIFYSSLYTLSQDDYLKLRRMILDFIENKRSLVAKSPEEVLTCFNLDFFRV